MRDHEEKPFLSQLSCNEVRKKKEMELQMLTGTIDNWQGEVGVVFQAILH